ncbi:MAG: AAA domain-containing protein [Candidatus Melainabacteria bacterium]|nr:AAA domain-containing protein [Candidatus Melainabacteria bacterium]
MTPNRIDEFIAALQDEIEAVKKNKAAATRIFDGKLTSQIGDNYIYTFSANHFFVGDDEAPALIEVGGVTLDCSLVDTDGLQVQIAVSLAVANSLGPEVHSALLTSNRATILLRLVNKFKEAKSKNLSQFKFAEEVFSGHAQAIVKVGTIPNYSSQASTAPNASQASAIYKSFSSSLAVIWGPPGTGKTRTIARVVEAHLNAGRRVLFVSHTNTAADAALEAIAEQLADTFYNQGKIIRLGLPKNPNLPKQYPLVILDKVVTASNAHLLSEREHIYAQLKPLEEAMKHWLALQKAANTARQLEKELQRPEQLENHQLRLQQTLAEIAHAQAQLEQAHHNLSIAQRSLDVSTQQTHIKDLNIFISTRQRFVAEIESRLNDAINLASANEAKLEQAHLDLDELMEYTGLTPNDVGQYIEANQPKINAGLARINEIEAVIKNGAAKVITEARVIGTTLSKLYLSSQLAEQMFDILIVDESSSVPMPHLYWALGKTTTGVTFIGDFKQLPPVVTADTKPAQKWLANSIFDQLDIATVEKAHDSELVSLLDTQYRMAPEIAALSSKLFYGGTIRSAESTKQLGMHDSVFGDSRVVIVDTSAVDQRCISPPGGSRLNLYSAGLAINLSKRLLQEHPEITVGVATPYRPQAELVAKALKEAGFGERALVNTVHSFQGGESSAIIFDCVDGKGSSKSMLDDFISEQMKNIGKKSQAGVWLNVALTRARAVFVLLVNRQYFVDNHRGGILCQFIDQIALNGLALNARQIDDCFTAKALDEAGAPVPAARRPTLVSSSTWAVLNEKDFWSAFHNDLNAAQEQALIVSPILTVKRCTLFIETFAKLVTKGVKLKVYTRPVAELPQRNMALEADAVIGQLQSIGVTVEQRSKIDQKIAIIDDRICWEGSLNLLCHSDKLEHMRRLEGSTIAREVRKSLRLD